MTEKEFFDAKTRIEAEIQEACCLFKECGADATNLSDRYKLALFPYLYEFAHSMWCEKHNEPMLEEKVFTQLERLIRQYYDANCTDVGSIKKCDDHMHIKYYYSCPRYVDDDCIDMSDPVDCIDIGVSIVNAAIEDNWKLVDKLVKENRTTTVDKVE